MSMFLDTGTPPRRLINKEIILVAEKNPKLSAAQFVLVDNMPMGLTANHVYQAFQNLHSSCKFFFSICVPENLKYCP